MIRAQIMRMAEQDPRYAQAISAMEAQVAHMPISPSDLDEAIHMFELLIKNPNKYQEIRQAAIKDNVIDPEMMPEQYDQVFVVSLLIAFYGLQDRLKNKTQGYARGGLAHAARQLQSQGRHGDTMLAHINPQEAMMLRQSGGSGTINPQTGLPEFFSLKSFFKAVLPIALSFIVPGLGTAIGGFLGASGVGASILGGAVLGGVTNAATGGDWKKGALFGGLGGGLGSWAGGAADKALGLGLGTTGQAILGGTLVGGGAGMLTGQGFAKGALQGAVGSGIGQLAGNASGANAFEQGVSDAGATMGNALTAGYDPKTSAGMGVLSGLAKAATYKPSDAVINNLKTGTDATSDITAKTVTMPDGTTSPAPGSAGTNAQGQTGTYQLDAATGKISLKVDAGSYAVNPQTGSVEWKAAEPSFFDKITKGGLLDKSTPATTGAKAPTGILGSGVTSGQVLGGLGLLSALQGAPDPVKEAVQQLSPTQQEYFNRPSISWDWNKLQGDANANNQSVAEYMATNWNKVSGGTYNTPPAQSTPATPVVQKARGGALAAVARFAQGAGSGRADTIDAKLSDGEYVIDAETVAMLGDGSNQEGAKRLDAMRENIRSHKGKALAKGKFSPNAKSPLSYLKGVA